MTLANNDPMRGFLDKLLDASNTRGIDVFRCIPELLGNGGVAAYKKFLVDQGYGSMQAVETVFPESTEKPVMTFSIWHMRDPDDSDLEDIVIAERHNVHPSHLVSSVLALLNAKDAQTWDRIEIAPTPADYRKDPKFR